MRQSGMSEGGRGGEGAMARAGGAAEQDERGGLGRGGVSKGQRGAKWQAGVYSSCPLRVSCCLPP